MSSEAPNPENVDDLIDLDEASTSHLPPQTANPDPIEINSDNLLDSELPVLEEKLKTSSFASLTEIGAPLTKNAVDVEDILITLDDDCQSPETFRERTIQRSHSAALLELNEPKTEMIRCISCENLEALDVLMKLDDILNATLEECDGSAEEPDEQVYDSISDCLLDLDLYLDGFEKDNASDSCEFSEREDASLETVDVRDKSIENVRDFRGFLYDNQLLEPSQLLHRATVSASGSKERPALRKSFLFRSLRTSSNPATPARISGSAYVSDEDIDWSWVCSMWLLQV